jgi:5-formyltetrahydrofolate cyclo-ligase
MAGMGSFSKASLRKEYLERRRSLELQQVQSMQAMMVQHMEQLPWPSGRWVMSYKSIGKNHEPTMHLFEQALLHFHKHITFCYPRTELSDCSMEAYADDDDIVWVATSFGVDEPAAGNIIDPPSFQIILVPMLAFDRHGYRVGYGKGFYDRYLKRCRPDVMKVGFSFFPPVDHIEDINANDVPLNYCITPHQNYAF